ncbi:ferrous iron transport protein A [Archaeoglobales archaeon]|nr:MAG: ferrous iron transport protein A [Archaeoglobales archaeon]RLI79592.1 MAG: ferrous iron transport protein A [Archaeoglobales archaeon]
MMPLALMREGSKGVVKEILGGRGAYTKLQEMGIVKGKEIRILRNSGALLVAVNGTKFVVGRGLAMKVMVDVGQES